MSLGPEDDTQSYEEDSDDVENAYEDEDSSTDSVNPDDDDDEVCERGARRLFPVHCCTIPTGILLRIDPTHPPSSPVARLESGDGGNDQNRNNHGSSSSLQTENNGNISNTSLVTVNQNSSSEHMIPSICVSASTSISDTGSDNLSTRATLGDSTADNMPALLDDEITNGNGTSSSTSLADSEVERVRRIHNSIFSSLEHDLAELVRIREETIQFLETGSRSAEGEAEQRPATEAIGGVGVGEQPPSQLDQPLPVNSPSLPDREDGDGGEENNNPSNQTNNQNRNIPQPFILRERLRFPIRLGGGDIGPSCFPHGMVEAWNCCNGGEESSTVTAGGRTYTPVGNYEEPPLAQPAKPYVERGLTFCDEKANCARKLLDKLQYGDPEDENACFVRRFWRETSTVDENSTSRLMGSASTSLSVDIASIAERTASLEASLEEAFDGLRMRLQQIRPEDGTPSSNNRNGSDENANSVAGEGNAGNNTNGTGSSSNNSNTNHTDQQANSSSSSVPYYQTWDDETSILDNPLNYDIWNELDQGATAGPTITARINMAERRTNSLRNIRGNGQRQQAVASTATAAGTFPGVEGGEMDDEDDSSDDDDDEEIASYFRDGRISRMGMSPNNREFLREMGITDRLSQDLFDMFSFTEEAFRMPSNAGESNNDLPDSLIPRLRRFRRQGQSEEGQESDAPAPTTASEEPPIQAGAQQDFNDSDRGELPVLERLHFSISPIVRSYRGDENSASSSVYLDPTNLNFPYVSEESQNQDQSQNLNNEDEPPEQD